MLRNNITIMLIFICVILFLMCKNSTNPNQDFTKLSVTLIPTHIGQYGALSGTIRANVNGGKEPYHFEWSDGSDSQTIERLIPGIYSLIVEDASRQIVRDTCNIRELKLFENFKMEQITESEDLHTAPAWSPDGKSISYCSHETGKYCIYSVPKSGGNRSKIVEFSSPINSNSWSSDGNQIAFSVKSPGTDANIWTVSTVDTSLSQITVRASDQIEPVWGIGDTAIVFADNRNGNWDIYSISTDGSNEKIHCESNWNDMFPAVSPCGNKIAFYSNRSGNGDVYLMKTDVGITSCLINHYSLDTCPSWSPDGKYIAFHSRRSGNFDIWVMPVEGGTPIQMTTNTADDSMPAWSPDGYEIAFRSNRSGNFNIWIMAFNYSPE